MAKKRSGRRKDAGRPTQDGVEGVKHCNVMLDEETIKTAKEVGYGGLSLGIRRLAKLYRDGGKTVK